MNQLFDISKARKSRDTRTANEVYKEYIESIKRNDAPAGQPAPSCSVAVPEALESVAKEILGGKKNVE